MSINQCSSSSSQEEWLKNNVRDETEGSMMFGETKEAMFEKALTPSDVGKLNRLVIPKQHAEKYFPLDSSSSKGLLLSFEDESGKCWRFRYSYWNSSQSYVLTKGWSRYVKDKRLHPGDVVFFHRHRLHPNRFFITFSTRHSTSSPPGGGSQGENERTRWGNSTSSSSSSSSRVLRLFGVNMECQPENDSQKPSTKQHLFYHTHQPSLFF
ncbi:hypothetical protein RJT34_19580 [Clitoria ternatea]|uniref:TF-B3 domain-containing protein n=1 Tax=Clitoria ternatea TaxID=43366 RepID=A0AAN9IRB8_CLITE